MLEVDLDVDCMRRRFGSGGLSHTTILESMPYLLHGQRKDKTNERSTEEQKETGEKARDTTKENGALAYTTNHAH